MSDELQGLPRLEIRSRHILLDRLEVGADIGFHDHEVGTPQRLQITVEIWMNEELDPAEDEKDAAWDYDFVRSEIHRIASARRYNLQETLVRAIFERLGSVIGVKALRVRSMKPDIYSDAEGVGVEFSSI